MVLAPITLTLYDYPSRSVVRIVCVPDMHVSGPAAYPNHHNNGSKFGMLQSDSIKLDLESLCPKRSDAMFSDKNSLFTSWQQPFVFELIKWFCLSVLGAIS